MESWRVPIRWIGNVPTRHGRYSYRSRAESNQAALDLPSQSAGWAWLAIEVSFARHLFRLRLQYVTITSIRPDQRWWLVSGPCKITASGCFRFVNDFVYKYTLLCLWNNIHILYIGHIDTHYVYNSARLWWSWLDRATVANKHAHQVCAACQHIKVNSSALPWWQ